MTIDQQQLVGLQRAEFDKAERLQNWMLGAQIGAAGLSGAGVLLTSGLWTYLAALGALGLAITWIWLWWHHRKTRLQADRARRATLIMEGLGEQISPAGLLDLEAGFTVPREEGQKREDPAYYAALAAPGDQRLAEMLEQSAFFSCHLMRASARSAWKTFLVFLLLGLFLLLMAVPFVGTEQLQGAARVFCALLTLLISAEVIGAALSYGASAEALSNLLPRLDALKAKGFPRADLLLLFSDYNAAVEFAPMFVPGAYKRERDRLNSLWNKRQSSS